MVIMIYTAPRHERQRRHTNCAMKMKITLFFSIRRPFENFV